MYNQTFIEVCRNEVYGAEARAGQKQEYTKLNACDLLMLWWTAAHSSCFQRTHKRPTFITSASSMQGADWEQGLLGHIHPTSPTPLWLLCSLCSFPASRREMNMDIPQANLPGPRSTQKTWNKRWVLRIKTTKIALEKWHPGNGKNFHPTVQMSHCCQEQKASKMQL